MNWISVDEKMPFGGFDWVLVYQNGAVNMMAYRKDKGFYEPYGCTAGNIVVNEITHWCQIDTHSIDGITQSKV